MTNFEAGDKVRVTKIIPLGNEDIEEDEFLGLRGVVESVDYYLEPESPSVNVFFDTAGRVSFFPLELEKVV